jgi:hypothetical protein
MKQSKPKRPSLIQASWLRRIASDPMMKTYVGNRVAVFSLQNGEEVPPHIAQTLIKNGWVKGQRDGIFDDPQTYIALTPYQPNSERGEHNEQTQASQ